MSLFNDFIQWMNARSEQTRSAPSVNKPQPAIYFGEITEVNQPPSNDNVLPGKLYFVLAAQRPKWALFQCPCGCQSVVTLSLQLIHKPHWSVTKSPENRPNLYPSVWRDKGCLSHFWIKDGRVFWCADTGKSPSTRRDNVR